MLWWILYTKSSSIIYFSSWDLFTDKPSVPVGPLECSAATEDSITLSWQPPASNGGSPLTSYIVEKSDVRKPKWVRVGKVSADQTSTTVESLLENVGYFFRVLAENKVGVSPPLENELPFKAKSPYGEFFTPAELLSFKVQKFYRFFIYIFFIILVCSPTPSPCPSVCLSVCLSLSLCFAVCPFVSVGLPLLLSLSLSIHLTIRFLVSFSLFICLPVCLSLSLAFAVTSTTPDTFCQLGVRLCLK